MHELTTWDILLTPITLFFLVFFAKRYRDRHYPLHHPLRKYYLRGLYAKFAGAIFIGLIFEFYYNGGGDSFNYFRHARTINSSLSESFSNWYQLLFRVSPEVNPQLFPYTSQMEWYQDPSSYTVARVAAVVGLLSGTTYLPIALLFAYISYSGIWAMYRTFVNIYPKLYKQLAVAFLFIPSTVVWGSGLYKDTLCMFGLGWMTYTTFRIFLHRDFSAKNLFYLALSFYLVGVIKLYILLSFLPALSLWILLSYSHKIRSAGIRFVMRFAFIALSIGGFIFFAQVFSSQMKRYSLETIAETSQTTRNWIAYSSGDEGSAYSLGDFDPGIGGMLKKFPAGVVVTLFRPFPWEAKKVIVVLSALEAILFLAGTLFVMFKLGLINFFKKIFKDPNLTFFFIFTMIFAFAVGISSYNFGTLSRYKIPCLPFYSALLIILYYTNRKKVEHARVVRKARQELQHT